MNKLLISFLNGCFLHTAITPYLLCSRLKDISDPTIDFDNYIVEDDCIKFIINDSILVFNIADPILLPHDLEKGDIRSSYKERGLKLITKIYFTEI